jgi:flagellar basal body P-ring formation protein FlgA
MRRASYWKPLVIAAVLGVAAAAYSQTAPEPNAAESVWLQIHLPREITAPQGALDLSHVAVVRGSPDRVAVAAKIGLGRLSLPGQKLVIDRPTILSRLAASGIPADKVLLTGADSVMVRNGQKAVDSEEFVLAGEQWLRDLLASRSVVDVTAVVKPKELTLTVEPQKLQLVPRLLRSDGRGMATVQIHVMADGRDVGSRDIPFRLRFKVRQPIVAKDIPSGGILSAENVRIEERVLDRPEAADWHLPYGMVAVRAMAADQEIRSDMVEAAQPPVLVRRNEAVTIRIQRPGLLITAMGTSLQEGRAGEAVKVRNADSSRIIVCKVNMDGTVEPMQ